MSRPSITDCIAYISNKIAHAVDSGGNHREKIAAGAPAKAYKCSLRRDYCEAIVSHLQEAQEIVPLTAYKLVPLEPTAEMLKACDTVIQGYGAKLVWERMVAAAPVAARVKFRFVRVLRVGVQSVFIQRCAEDGAEVPRSPVTETTVSRFNGGKSGFTLHANAPSGEERL